MAYITNVLAPKEYRLELKNRLENLCTLSGTPMSPGLSAWITKTFGLEMTRVMQDYSSFTAPVFSPELQERINRIVPTNYQGYDANLAFKQLFDVSCAPPSQRCYWYLDIYSSPDQTFDDWTIDGEPFLDNLYDLTGNCSDQVNAFDSIGFLDERIMWTYDYDYNLPPVPDFRDSGGDPVFVSWQQGNCDITCWEVLIPQSDNFLYSFTTGTNITVYTDAAFGNVTDLTNAIMVAQISTYYTSLYGPQCSVSVTDDGSGNFYVLISNSYESFNPTWVTYGNTYYFNQVSC